MALAILIPELAEELNDTMTANNGGTVMVAIAKALSGGLGNGITDRLPYHAEAEHIAHRVFPAIKALASGGGATGNGIVTIAYTYAAAPTVAQFTDIQAWQADFKANFATYYPALAAL